MDTRDKLIGIAMILAGVGCIVLGCAFLGRNTQPTPNNNNNNSNIVYNEQQNNVYQELQNEYNQ